VRWAQYKDYIDSGIEWLGEIPNTWGKEPLKYVANFINGAPFKPAEWSDDGIPIIRIVNLNEGDQFNYYSGDMPQKYHVNCGDLLFGWSGNRGTSFGPFLWQKDGLHYLNQHIFRLEGFKCDRKWLYWALKAVTRYIEQEAHGIIGMVHITKGKLGAIKVPTISVKEQRAIADFLDRKTGQIDQLIAKKERQIELLNEKRAALISRAVTKGLNPDAKIKDSGIEWIGEIPEHWEVIPFKYTINFQEGPGIMADDFRDDGVPLLRIGNLGSAYVSLAGCNYLDPIMVRKKWRHFRLNAGDILISCSATTGIVSTVDKDAQGSIAYTGIICLKPNHSRIIPDFIKQIVISSYYINQINILKAGSTIQHYGPTHLRQITIALPPLEEQIQITIALEQLIASIDQSQSKIESSISLLHEYRSALITAAVTGQIDVRGEPA
jgi:type I restriction enzyme S subunit